MGVPATGSEFVRGVVSLFVDLCKNVLINVGLGGMPFDPISCNGSFSDTKKMEKGLFPKFIMGSDGRLGASVINGVLVRLNAIDHIFMITTRAHKASQNTPRHHLY